MTGTQQFTATGHRMFAQYAYPPNRLGYCGPADSSGLLDIAAGTTDGSRSQSAADANPGIRELARAFDGAWIYLDIIGEATGLDPLDPQVVEAYWIGNDLLEKIDPVRFVATVKSRFSSEIGAYWAGLDGNGPPSVPHHGFQVFTIYPWVPLLGKGETALTVLDRCRIRWGQVEFVDDDHLVVSCQKLRWDGHELGLGPVEVERARWAEQGRSLISVPERGQWLALHWDWACAPLTEAQLHQLQRRTFAQLDTTNRAIAQS
ncbi:DUF6390 family protein [Jatrophihabitans sp. DSM 45814]